MQASAKSAIPLSNTGDSSNSHRTRMRTVALAVLFGSTLFTQNSAAQQARPDTTPVATAVRADRAPVIDGRDDDPIW